MIGTGALVEPYLERSEVLAGAIRGQLLRRTERDVNHAAIGTPAIMPARRTKLIVSVGKTTIVFVAERIGWRIRIGIRIPQNLDEGVAIGVGLEVEESTSLRVRDDVGNFLIEPGGIFCRHRRLSGGQHTESRKNQDESEQDMVCALCESHL